MIPNFNKSIRLLMLAVVFLMINNKEAVSANDPLDIAFTAVVIKEDMYLNNRLIRYLADKLGREVRLIYKRSYKDIDDLLERGAVGAAWICGAPYVVDHDRFGIELLVVPQVTGYKEGSYRSLIIVPVESHVQSFDDLKGKTFAFSDPLSNSGRVVPTYMLARMGEAPDSFFKEYIYTYAHYESIQAVAEGFVDGASVDSYVYDAAARFNPELVEKTRVIEKSGWHGFTPIVIRKGVSKGFKEQLRKVFMNMEDDPEGKAILEAYGFDRFINPSDTLYDSIREMMRFISRFKVARETK
ncbi:MAG: phosphate/phosphite/phosphonate ABC transporter substrate-binding protein [Thermodesulfobacteriota bacterium]